MSFIQVRDHSIDTDTLLALDGISSFEGASFLDKRIDAFPVCSREGIINSKRATNRNKGCGTLRRPKDFQIFWWVQPRASICGLEECTKRTRTGPGPRGEVLATLPELAPAGQDQAKSSSVRISRALVCRDSAPRGRPQPDRRPGTRRNTRPGSIQRRSSWSQLRLTRPSMARSGFARRRIGAQSSGLPMRLACGHGLEGSSAPTDSRYPTSILSSLLALSDSWSLRSLASRGSALRLKSNRDRGRLSVAYRSSSL